MSYILSIIGKDHHIPHDFHCHFHRIVWCSWCHLTEAILNVLCDCVYMCDHLYSHMIVGYKSTCSTAKIQRYLHCA